MSQHEQQTTEELKKKLIFKIETALTEKDTTNGIEIESLLWDLCSYIEQFDDSTILDLVAEKKLNIIPYLIALRRKKTAFHQRRLVNKVFGLAAKKTPQFVLPLVSTISKLLSTHENIGYALYNVL